MEILFDGDDSGNHQELFAITGTTTTELTPGVSTVNNNFQSGLQPAFITPYGSNVIYDGVDPSTYTQLYISSQTSLGATEISPSNAATNADNSIGFLPENFVRYNGLIYFSGATTGPSSTTQLWQTNGTTAGTVIVGPVAGASTKGLDPTNLIVENGKLLFEGVNTAGNYDLWTSDGTAAGTVDLGTIAGAYSGGIEFSNPAQFQGKILFNGVDSSSGSEVWISDGTVAGTTELSAGVSQGALDPKSFAVIGSTAVFIGTTASGATGLFVTNGAVGSVSQITGIVGASPNGLQPANLVSIGTKAVFTGEDAAGKYGLWVTDGTAVGTVELAVVGAKTTGFGFDPTATTSAGTQAVFAGYDSSGQNEVWITDGTSAGTTELTAGLGSASLGLVPGSFAVVACFTTGTHLQTPSGAVAVETLTIGDILLTAAGQHRPIKWIGRRSYAGRFLAANPGVQPVRFSAGSLGEGLPCRDLMVSPEHAMFLDGLLIPARCLVNGTTITQERGLERVDYFHVELDSHDVLLAEGAPSESYLDDDSRGMFHNASEYAALYPDAPTPGGFCAPKVEEGYQLEAIRQRLAATAGEIAAAA